MMTLPSIKALCFAQALTLSNAKSFRGVESHDDTIATAEELAKTNRHGYAIALQEEQNHFCGGSLIAPDVVLTAAHCDSPFDYWVEVGGHHYRPFMNDDSTEKVGITTKSAHPKYDAQTMNNDLILLFLEHPASENVPIVKINSETLSPAVNDVVSVMGWGASAIDNFVLEMNDVMNSAQVHVWSNDECEMSRDSSYERKITENMMCAEAVGSDGCHTDSGGPLVIRGDDASEDIQVGIVSWGHSCSDEHLPGVYTRVSSHYEWIRTQVCEKSASPPAAFDCGGMKAQ